jgi:hypothetical protein
MAAVPWASFNNDKLRELADQPIRSEFKASVEEQETSMTEMSTGIPQHQL